MTEPLTQEEIAAKPWHPLDARTNADATDEQMRAATPLAFDRLRATLRAYADQAQRIESLTKELTEVRAHHAQCFADMDDGSALPIVDRPCCKRYAAEVRAELDALKERG